MSVLDAVEERLLMYMGLAYHGYGLWTWYYAETGEMYYTNSPYGEELKTFFYLGGCQDYALSLRKEPSNPFLMSDSVGLLWLGEYVHQAGKESRFVIVGPAFPSPAFMNSIERSLKDMDLSVSVRNSYAKLLMDVPIVSGRDFHILARVLHLYILLGDTADLELRYQRTQNPLKDQNEERADNFEDISFREQMFLQSIREGNENYRDYLSFLQDYGEAVFAEGNPNRSSKDRAIILVSQCARAAMDGGAPVRAAGEAEASFIRRIEQIPTSTDLMNLVTEMAETFVRMVGESRADGALSPEIRSCCAYIKKHMTQPLTLQKLAGEIGYTEYYLSRKFQKEMGVKLLDYIKQVRLDYAKILLSTTRMTVQDISEKLQFGTRSYFTRIFKEYVGMSPADFRSNAMGKIREGKSDEAEGKL